MQRHDHRPEQILTRDLPVAAEDEVVVVLQQLRAILSIETRQLVPRDGGPQEMTHMPGVLEKHQAEQRVGLDARDAPTAPSPHAMLDEGTQQAPAKAAISYHQYARPP